MREVIIESNGERAVEVSFICEMLEKYGHEKNSILDVGGIPTDSKANAMIESTYIWKRMVYHVCDFRGGTYRGDFVTLEEVKKELGF